jgi:hypothetical protein
MALEDGRRLISARAFDELCAAEGCNEADMLARCVRSMRAVKPLSCSCVGETDECAVNNRP